MGEGGQWVVDQRPYDKHDASVEDIQWSPTEEPLLVSCSVDRTIRLWDTRARPIEACVHTVEKAHDKDINVLSWNKFDPLLVTGSDDAVLNVWSLKTIQAFLSLPLNAFSITNLWLVSSITKVL